MSLSLYRIHEHSLVAILWWLDGVDQPLPIPNREVKLTCADGTALPCGRVGSRQFFKGDNRKVVSFFVCPARTYSNGRKSPNRPDSVKATAKDKGVHREVESEGSRRQTSGLTDRNPIQGLWMRMRLHEKSKSDSYPNHPR